jgi:hypothetical protein
MMSGRSGDPDDLRRLPARTAAAEPFRLVTRYRVRCITGIAASGECILHFASRLRDRDHDAAISARYGTSPSTIHEFHR